MSTTTTWTNGLPDTTGYSRYGPSPYDDVPDGLELVVELDWGGSWSFDMICVWRNTATQELRGAVDSGCSCPTPFADLTWEHMRPIRTVDDALSLLGYADDWGNTIVEPPPAEVLADLKAKVHQALR